MPVLRATEPCGRARCLCKLRKRYRKLLELRGNKDRSLSIFETNSSTWENKQQNKTATADLLPHFFRPIKYERQVHIISYFPLLVLAVTLWERDCKKTRSLPKYISAPLTGSIYANRRWVIVTMLFNQWSEDRCRNDNYLLRNITHMLQ
jgi:hypothetical protein